MMKSCFFPRFGKSSVTMSAILVWVFFPMGCADATAGQGDRVILLHGLGRSQYSMLILAHRLRKAGFDVENIDYPSTRMSVPELVGFLHDKLSECCRNDLGKIHFVTHSMGGILTRAYLSRYRPKNLGRVVMLSPPNRGSPLVDRFKENPLFQWALGPAATQLGTGSGSLPNRLGPADFELGIITGNRTFNPIGAWLIAGEDDGTVPVDSARLQGMAAFLVVPHGHTFIMDSAAVAREIVEFLRHGSFSETVPE
jgi:triacylglycerol lipase